MSHAVFLKNYTTKPINVLKQYAPKLNEGSSESQSKELGNVMAEIGCEIIFASVWRAA